MHHFLVSAMTAAALKLKRTCPRCGASVIAAPDRRVVSVHCHRCGAEVPPPEKR
ncbi:MAG: hypothetical protein R3A52_01400 [Polyangiales bacterium]